MVYFGQRKELVTRYEQWLKDSHAKDCPFNVISFLVLYNLIDPEAVREFLADGENSTELKDYALIAENKRLHKQIDNLVSLITDKMDDWFVEREKLEQRICRLEEEENEEMG